MIRPSLWISLCLWLCAHAVAAQTFPDRTDPHINDFGDLVTSGAEVALRGELERLEEATGVEMVIVTLTRLAEYAQGETLESFATALFEAWRIGDPEFGDGVMILVAREDRVMRIELGPAFGRDWDGIAVDVIAQDFRPALSTDNWSGGLQAGTTAVIERIIYPYLDDETPSFFGSGGFWALVLLGLGMAGYAMRRTLGNLLVRVQKCPDCGHRRLSQSTETLSKPTHRLPGQARSVRTCANCGFSASTLLVLAMTDVGYGSHSGSSGSGGGGGGGGGGSGSF